MKKLLFSVILGVAVFANISAQDTNSTSADVLSKGSWIIEANTGSATTGNTSFAFSSGNIDVFSVGVESGYFISDNLAIKIGLGYGSFNSNSNFVYKIGGKYYINRKFPVGIDFTGVSNGANWIGIQGGYAWFIANNVSLEPAVRYNAGIDSNSIFQGLIGFVIHL